MARGTAKAGAGGCGWVTDRKGAPGSATFKSKKKKPMFCVESNHHAIAGFGCQFCVILRPAFVEASLHVELDELQKFFVVGT